jgi:hypothetical protein
MPVYNGERFVRQALDSLVAQSFTDLEIVISDTLDFVFLTPFHSRGAPAPGPSSTLVGSTAFRGLRGWTLRLLDTY